MLIHEVNTPILQCAPSLKTIKLVVDLVAISVIQAVVNKP